LTSCDRPLSVKYTENWQANCGSLATHSQ